MPDAASPTVAALDSLPPTTLLLTRHGQSTWNADKRWQGQADPPLSDLGREQAWEAARAVGTVDLVATSPQQRALETATIISDMIGVGPLVALDGLRERSAGPWSGLTRDDIEEAYPNWLADGRRPDGFESDEELLERVLPTLHAIAATCPGGSILVVCHGGVIRTVETHLGIDEGRVPEPVRPNHHLAQRIMATGRPAPPGRRRAVDRRGRAAGMSDQLSFDSVSTDAQVSADGQVLADAQGPGCRRRPCSPST